MRGRAWLPYAGTVAAEVGHGTRQPRATGCARREDTRPAARAIGPRTGRTRPRIAMAASRTGHQQREPCSDVAANDGMGAIGLGDEATIKFGPLPMYVIAPQNTAENQIR